MAKITAAARTGLENKVEEHNEKYGDTPSKRVTYRMLEASFKRGIGAYKTNPQSVRPNVKSPEQWAFARVNGLLHAIRTGKFKRGAFDRDLLPKGHPLSTKKSADDLYETTAEATSRAKEIGCVGYHVHEVDGTVMFMPCDSMSEYERLTGLAHTSDDDLSLTEKAEWDAAYRNALPDTAFFYIEPGGEKEDGITRPYSLRKLPYRNASGQPDPAHLRAVLSRLSSTDIPQSAKDKIRTEARRLLEEATAEKALAKAYEDINFTPPKGVQEAAELGLALRREHGRGGTAIGVARARDLSNGEDMSPETIKRMVSFFARHRVDLKAPSNSDRSDPGYPGAGRIAWLLWGGDPGDTWSKKVSGQMKREDAEKSVCSTDELNTLENRNPLTTMSESVEEFLASTSLDFASTSLDFALSIVPAGEHRQIDTRHTSSGSDKIEKSLPSGIIVDVVVTNDGHAVATDLLFANETAVVDLPYRVRKEILLRLLDDSPVQVSPEIRVESAADVVFTARQAYDTGNASQIRLRPYSGIYGEPVTALELATQRDALWKFVPPRKSESPQALFVTGSPNEVESILGRPLAGPDGATFREAYLERMDLTVKDVTIAHATPGSVDIDWTAWLGKLVEEHKNMPIIALGKTASLALQNVDHITMPHPRAVRIKGDRGEVARKARRIRKSIDEKQTQSVTCPIFKADDDKRIVYGIVLEPDTVDLQGDVLGLDTIEEAAHKYLVASRLVGDSHSQKAEAEVVESYLAPADVELGGQVIKQGTWIMGVKVLDDSMWQAVKAGEYTGFSIGGRGERNEIQTG